MNISLAGTSYTVNLVSLRFFRVVILQLDEFIEDVVMPNLLRRVPTMRGTASGARSSQNASIVFRAVISKQRSSTTQPVGSWSCSTSTQMQTLNNSTGITCNGSGKHHPGESWQKNAPPHLGPADHGYDAPNETPGLKVQCSTHTDDKITKQSRTP